MLFHTLSKELKTIILEHADDKARELLEVFLAAELGVEQHHKVAGVGLGRTGLRSKSIS